MSLSDGMRCISPGLYLSAELSSDLTESSNALLLIQLGLPHTISRLPVLDNEFFHKKIVMSDFFIRQSLGPAGEPERYSNSREVAYSV